jgi:putative transposase
MLTVVTDDDARADEAAAALDEIVREGARRMLLATLEAEVTGYIDALAGELDEHGHRLVVRNGYAEPRTITTAAGGIEIEAPRVNDRRVDPETGERCRFRSAIVPPWCRKSPKVAEVLPLMYLHGMSTGDFAPALTEFFGTGAGLSASVITRLSKQWQDERAAFARRDLSDVDYVYVWVDGIHFNVRLEEERLCALVVVGVRSDGTKELVAIEDGYRESTESWADLLRDLKQSMCGDPSSPAGCWKRRRECRPKDGHAGVRRCHLPDVGGIPSASSIRWRPFRGVKGTLRDSGAAIGPVLRPASCRSSGASPPCPRSSPLDPPSRSAGEVAAFA